MVSSYFLNISKRLNCIGALCSCDSKRNIEVFFMIWKESRFLSNPRHLFSLDRSSNAACENSL